MQEKIGIHVVTLPGAEKRQAYMRQQFADLGMDFQFHYGVNGNKEKTEIWAFYDEKRRMLAKGYPLNNGELGCFASHYQLWVKCLREQKPIVVLEDDASLAPEAFKAFCEQAASLPDAIEHLKLFAEPGKKGDFQLRSVTGHADFRVYYRGPMLTIGYYLSPAGAQKLLRHIAPLILPVDIYMDSYWVHGVTCFGLNSPAVNVLNPFDTQIQLATNGRRRPKRTPTAKLKREIYSAWQGIKRVLAYYFVLRSPRITEPKK